MDGCKLCALIKKNNSNLDTSTLREDVICPKCKNVIFKCSEPSTMKLRQIVQYKTETIKRKSGKSVMPCFGCGILIGEGYINKIPHYYFAKTLCDGCDTKLNTRGYLNIDDHNRYFIDGSIHRWKWNFRLSENDKELRRWINSNIRQIKNMRGFLGS